MGYKEINEEKTGFKFETNVWELFTEAEQRDDVDIEEAIENWAKDNGYGHLVDEDYDR